MTCANFVCDHRPLKPEPFRIRLVVGGDKSTFLEDAGSPAASMLETKLLMNSVISNAHDDQGSRVCTSDMLYFYDIAYRDVAYLQDTYRFLIF